MQESFTKRWPQDLVQVLSGEGNFLCKFCHFKTPNATDQKSPTNFLMSPLETTQPSQRGKGNFPSSNSSWQQSTDLSSDLNPSTRASSNQKGATTTGKWKPQRYTIFSHGTTVENSHNAKHWRARGENHTLLYCCWEWKYLERFERKLAIPSKTESALTVQQNDPPSSGLAPKETLFTCARWDLGQGCLLQLCLL